MSKVYPDYGTRGSEVAHEFEMFLKSEFRRIVGEYENSRMTFPQLISHGIIYLIKFPFLIMYEIGTHNVAVAYVFSMFWTALVIWFIVACIIQAMYSLELGYKAVRSVKMMLQKNYRPWDIILYIMGIRHGDKSSIFYHDEKYDNLFIMDVFDVPMTAIMIQIAITMVADLVISLILSILWPLWAPMFFLATIFSFKSPKLYYIFARGNDKTGIFLNERRLLETLKYGNEKENNDELLEDDCDYEEEDEEKEEGREEEKEKL
jgi:hypothetical protein